MAGWEYHIEALGEVGELGDAGQRGRLTRTLNDLGRMGWELVGMAGGPVGATDRPYALIFKRPLPDRVRTYAEMQDRR